MAFNFKNIQEFIRGVIEPHTKAIDTKLDSVAEGMLQNNASIREMIALEATSVTQLIKISTELTTLKINPDKSNLLNFVYVETIGNEPTYPKVGDKLPVDGNVINYVTNEEDIENLNVPDGGIVSVIEGNISSDNSIDTGTRSIGYLSNLTPGTIEFNTAVTKLGLKKCSLFTLIDGDVVPMSTTQEDGNVVGYMYDMEPEDPGFTEAVNKLGMVNGGIFAVVKSTS